MLTPTRFLVPGLLAMRGVERPLTLQAALLSREAAGGVADFELKGTLRRSAFGMSAEHLLISDQVALAIRARIRLAG